MPSITKYKFNLTPNKTWKGPNWKLRGIVMHETVGWDAHSAMDWNMHAGPDVGLERGYIGSANYYVDRDGAIYWFVDEQEYAAWHAGQSEFSLDGSTYDGLDVSRVTVGIEVVGPNNGTPVTEVQYRSVVWLVGYLCDKYDIPIDRAHIKGHSEIARPIGRKSDPRGYSLDKLVRDVQMAHVGGSPVDNKSIKSVGIKGGFILMANSNVRLWTNTHSRVLYTTDEPEDCKIYGKRAGEQIGGSSTWYLVHLGGPGLIGWVHSSLVRLHNGS